MQNGRVTPVSEADCGKHQVGAQWSFMLLRKPVLLSSAYLLSIQGTPLRRHYVYSFF